MTLEPENDQSAQLACQLAMRLGKYPEALDAGRAALGLIPRRRRHAVRRGLRLGESGASERGHPPISDVTGAQTATAIGVGGPFVSRPPPGRQTLKAPTTAAALRQPMQVSSTFKSCRPPFNPPLSEGTDVFHVEQFEIFVSL